MSEADQRRIALNLYRTYYDHLDAACNLCSDLKAGAVDAEVEHRLGCIWGGIKRSMAVLADSVFELNGQRMMSSEDLANLVAAEAVDNDVMGVSK